MKKSLITLSLFCISYSIAAQSKIDVLGYKYEIRLSDTTDNIYGIATIYFKANEPAEFLELDFTKISKNGKGMKITDLNTPAALDIRITASPMLIEYSHENDKVKIKLPKKLLAGEHDTIAIEYKGIPADGLIISKNQFGNRTFFADNWPNRAHNWIPCVDDPADKASVEFIVTAPSHYQVISNGEQIEETNLPGNKKLTHYKEDVPLPTKVMVIGVADFAVNTVGEINCVPVYSWVYPENKKEGFYDYAIAKDILAWHINYIGAYPYKKLANVQSKTRFGGMENAGAIFYAEYSVSGQRLEEELMSHEIVHQWFGNMATEKNFAHLWLSEGFATYLTHVYIESKYGIDSLNNEMKNDREKVIAFVKTSQRPVVDSTPNYMQLLNANSYQKGSWVLHMLRRELGDSIFKKSIRQYYATYAGKNADTKDLQRIFEMVSGKKLDTFFNQWLHTAENPSLDIKWGYDQKKKQLTININQKQSYEFRFPLEIALTSKTGKPVIEKLLIDRKSKTFTFSAPAKPLAVIADPTTSLLFEGTVSEVK
jgi:aminopeptidase N